MLNNIWKLCYRQQVEDKDKELHTLREDNEKNKYE